MLSGIEKVLLENRPDGLLIYGDTNSTLAGALAASKLHIPVFHVEAGLRSFDKTMPEEINRIVADHVSTVLFAPTDTAIGNLVAEGIISHDVAVNTPDKPLVVKTGDVMYDNALYYRNLAAGKSRDEQPFILATIHRDHNTDHPERLRTLLDAIGQVAAMYTQPVLLPLHPRTAKCLAALESGGWRTPASIRILNPVSYLEMIALESACSLVITDSGGVQKEAFFFRKPCIILRPHTEWVEIVESGNAAIAGDDPHKILLAAEKYLKHAPEVWPEIFGDGHAAEKIVEVILKTI
jgi:UDP-GlcNAc3NAcA epimerase